MVDSLIEHKHGTRKVREYISFVAGALREISVGLCRGNFFMYRACLGMFANLHFKSSGTGFRAGMRVPTDEHGLL
jgi:hypothetical protein